jgi:hypothetical protein
MTMSDVELVGPVATLIECLADLDADLTDAETGLRMLVERVEIDTPMELDVGVSDEGVVSLFAGPPTQTVATTWMPVFHQIRLTIGTP